MLYLIIPNVIFVIFWPISLEFDRRGLEVKDCEKKISHNLGFELYNQKLYAYIAQMDIDNEKKSVQKSTSELIYQSVRKRHF